MLRSSYSRIVSTVALAALVLVQCPARAEKSLEIAQNDSVQAQVLSDPRSEGKPILIAQACSGCGAELADVAAAGGISLTSKKRDKSLLTDSLWGNLILELAYQRDKQLIKLAKRMGILNFGTMAAVSTIAASTLAQGVVALKTLNPTDGHEDSYVPGAIGVTLSGATILAFVARAYLGHRMQVAVENRQLAVKREVEAVLAHLEHANGQCPDAQKELTGLIGLRASAEWLQLWRSSHKLAVSAPPKISLSEPDKLEQNEL